MKGNCADDMYPDYWFPELRRGASSNAFYQRVANKIDYAMDKCYDCPIKQACYDMGMEQENLPYGIWGGVLAGERLRSLGYNPDDYTDLSSPITKALHLERVIRPYLKGRHEETNSNSSSTHNVVLN